MAKYTYKDNLFVSDKGDDIKKLYTKSSVIVRNVEKEFVQKGVYVSSTKDDGYLGPWNYDIELGSNILYIVSSGEIQEFVIFEQKSGNKSLTYYITNIGGYIHNCQPEEGDIIYTTYKEAKLEVLNTTKQNMDTLDNTTEVVQIYVNQPYNK